MKKDKYYKTLNKAYNILKPKEEEFCNKASVVFWVEEDYHSIDGDYCEYCIDKAIEQAKKDNLENDNEIKEYSYSHSCGGYESCNFVKCDICGEGLLVTLIPNKDALNYCLYDLKYAVEQNIPIWDELAYQINDILYEFRCGQYEEPLNEIALRIANLVINYYNKHKTTMKVIQINNELEFDRAVELLKENNIDFETDWPYYISLENELGYRLEATLENHENIGLIESLTDEEIDKIKKFILSELKDYDTFFDDTWLYDRIDYHFIIALETIKEKRHEE